MTDGSYSPPYPGFSRRSGDAETNQQNLAISWPKNVTELHVHLGGSVPLYRLWEIAIDRGIRGIGSGYEDFINILKIQAGKVKDLRAKGEEQHKAGQHTESMQSLAAAKKMMGIQ